jgi:hypothetical protein
MWLQADVARALLLIGLLLCMVALGGEEVSRYMADAVFSMQAAESGTAGAVTVTGPLGVGCQAAP